MPAVCAEIPTPFEAEKLVGGPAPDFALRDLGGRPVSLSALRGKVVLLNFWGSWSPPSKAELPALEALYRLLRTRGIEVVGVSTDTDLERARDFLKGFTVSFPLILEGGRTLSRSSYKVFIVPTTFLIGRNGTIIKSYYGGRRWDSREVLGEIEETVTREK